MKYKMEEVAKEWLELITAYPNIPHDHDAMVIWFVNIFNAGYDLGRRDGARK